MVVGDDFSRATEIGVYDDYHECYWTEEQAESLLDDYHKWCKANKQLPEVDRLELVGESNIAHVAYHALIQRSQHE